MAASRMLRPTGEPQPLQPREAATAVYSMRFCCSVVADRFEARLSGQDVPPPGLPRWFLLEEEYMTAMLRAEVAWLRGISDDLRSGRLRPPTEAEMRRLSSLPGAPSEAALHNVIAQPAPTPGGSRRRTPRAPRAPRAAVGRRQ
jgi:hypothetical protein